jgi:hypothetical protein
MKSLLLVALAVALLLVGCGDNPPSDPFVGTWRVDKLPDSGFVVVKLDQSYYANVFGDNEAGGWLRYERRGDELVSDLSLGGTRRIWRLVADGNDILRWKTAGSDDIVLKRSDSPKALGSPSAEEL